MPMQFATISQAYRRGNVNANYVRREWFNGLIFTVLAASAVLWQINSLVQWRRGIPQLARA